MDDEAPIIQPYQPLYDLALAKIYNGNKASLDSAIAAEPQDGNELFILRQLISKVRTKEVPGDVAITGYNLQTYRRGGGESETNRGFSTYVLTADGIKTIHFDKRSDLPNPKDVGVDMAVFGAPITWTHVRQVHDLMNDSTFLSVHPGKTKFAPAKTEDVGRTMWQLARPYAEENIKDGFGIWRAYITGFSKVNKFGTDGETEALLDGGKANMNVIISPTPPPPTGRTDNGVFLKLTDEVQLHQLFGALYNEMELLSEDGLKTMSSSLRGTPVIIFGRGKTPEAKGVAPQYRVKKPKISFDLGLGRIVPFSG
jgi:hypothetical protein